MPGLISMSSAAVEGGSGGGGGSGKGSIEFGTTGVTGGGGWDCDGIGVGGGWQRFWAVGVGGEVVTNSRASGKSSDGLEGSKDSLRRFLATGVDRWGDMDTWDEESVSTEVVFVSKSCSLFTSANPLILSDSATFNNGPICSWDTFISPLYMNSTAAFNSGHLTSFKMTIGCWHGFSKNRAWK